MGTWSPNSKEWTCTERMKRGRDTCWNLSWMKLRIVSARASPSGPAVSLCQSISMDITSCFAVCWKRKKDGEEFGIQR